MHVNSYKSDTSTDELINRIWYAGEFYTYYRDTVVD